MSQDFIGRPHDFDFLVGPWQVTNRRLRQCHVGSHDWDEFPSQSQAYSHLGFIRCARLLDEHQDRR